MRREPTQPPLLVRLSLEFIWLLMRGKQKSLTRPMLRLGWVSVPLKSDDKGREPTRPPPLNSYNFNLTWGLNAHLKGLRLQWVRWQEGNNLLGGPHWSDCCSAGAGCSIPNPPSVSFYRISILTHNHKTVGFDLRAGFLHIIYISHNLELWDIVDLDHISQNLQLWDNKRQKGKRGKGQMAQGQKDKKVKGKKDRKKKSQKDNK